MKYLSTNPSANEAAYRVEDGVIVDPLSTAQDFRAFSRQFAPTAFDRKVEEARWAARSGPVTITRPARRLGTSRQEALA